MRKFAILAMVLLAAAALFWGNCLTCPQMLLASHQPAHPCCPNPHPGSVHCTTHEMQHFVKADAGAPAPTVPTVAESIEPAASVSLPRQWKSTPLPSEHAPPDLLLLTASFRI